MNLSERDLKTLRTALSAAIWWNESIISTHITSRQIGDRWVDVIRDGMKTEVRQCEAAIRRYRKLWKKLKGEW